MTPEGEERHSHEGSCRDLVQSEETRPVNAHNVQRKDVSDIEDVGHGREGPYHDVEV